VNEWQPFWKNLTEQINSLSQRVLPEVKERTGWLSRFLPSLNSPKSESSISFRESPTPTSSSAAELPAQAAINEPDSENIVDLRIPEDKPKPRTPKAKPRPKPVAQPARKMAVRFPTRWRTVSPGNWQVPQQAAAPRRSAAKLPAAWATQLRAGANKAIVIDSPLPERPLACDVNTKRIVEAMLFAANRPLTIKQIQEAFPELEQPETLEIQLALEAITQDYLTRPIGLKLLASGYRFQIREGMAPWVMRLFEEKPSRYSRALLETLSIIAYRQPVTRGEIEDIRGVSVSSGIIHTLLEREWIRVIAHKEVPGRPALYGTTKQFLDYFNLTSLNELPALDEIIDLDFSNELPQQESRERPQTESSQDEYSASAPAGAEVAAEPAEAGAESEPVSTIH
jgi:segregation and condensation protein B